MSLSGARGSRLRVSVAVCSCALGSVCKIKSRVHGFRQDPAVVSDPVSALGASRVGHVLKAADSLHVICIARRADGGS